MPAHTKSHVFPPFLMLSVTSLSVEFSARLLFKGVSFVINPKDRVTLVGKNGAGKSTLLKVLSGLQEPTSGIVALQKDATIGYLPQVMVLSDEHTVREEAEKAFAEVKKLQERIEKENEELSARTDYDSTGYQELVERFAYDNDRFAMMGGMNYHATLERTLLGLGFKQEDFDRPTRELSGGWRMRIELAKLLMQQPDILLLDEPTNHLDIASIRWLEQYLQRLPGAVILVSHDRAFINNVTNRTMEISCGTITDYRTRYDEFVLLRKERREQQLRAYENQQKEIAEIKDFIERFRYKPTKAVQVQSRIKQLNKIVPIEVDEVDNSYLHLKFPPCDRSGDYPVICEDVAKSYGEHVVIRGVNLTIKRGEKVAFVGKNGEGKSTLVKCIMGDIPFEGYLKIGQGVKIGYYAQNEAQLLDGEKTVFDTIDDVATGDIRLKIRDLLGAFMFGGEASDKKVKVLSGGERSRLAMLRMLLQPFNLLILDEPTNHLDMRTKDVLKEAVRNFGGTVIVVSHDRDFLDGLVERVYEFGGGKVLEHIGGIYDFLREKEAEEPALKTDNAPAASHKQEKSAESEPQNGGRAYAERKEAARQRRKFEKAVADCEKRIADLEKQQAEIEDKLSTPEGAADAELAQQYATISKELEDAMWKWQEAAEALEHALT